MMERRRLLRLASAALAFAAAPACAQTQANPQTQRRSQLPAPPFPYGQDEVIVSGIGGARLTGTITLPRARTRHPAILLLSVAGPNDRDLSFAGHRAFAVLADRLTRAGFAVLRCDDRGVGGSEGDWSTAGYEVLAGDARSAIALLRGRPDIDPNRVGAFGLSEGAVIAGMTAATLEVPLSFVVLASPPGLPGEAALRSQFVRTLALSGIAGEAEQAYLRTYDDFIALTRAAAVDPTRMAELEQFVAGPGAMLIPPYQFVPREPAALARFLSGPWYQSQLDVVPAQHYARLRAPCLVVGGDRDLIVPAEENFPPIREAARDAEFQLFENVSHLLQPSQTGLPAEYAANEITIDPRVLDAVASWLTRRAR